MHTPQPAFQDQISILGIRVDNLTMEQALLKICQFAKSDQPAQVFFLNAHCVNLAYKHPNYRRALDKAELVLPDGSGLALAGKISCQPIRENVNGTDLFPRLCALLEGSNRSLFLLGAQPGVAEQTAEWITRYFPGLRVAGCHHGHFQLSQNQDVAGLIRQSGADILLVAMGVPRQEEWLHNNIADCGNPVGLAVGGLFDFYSGRIPRAPLWLRRLGMEWIWRLLQEPRRMWRRYLLGNFLFTYRVLKARLKPKPR